MAEYTATFKRKEVKYRLSAAQAAQIKQSLAAHMAPDAYGQTAITSRYYDTVRRDMISRSLEKPLYKEKLRLRIYGDPAPDSAVFVELKKKHRGIVYKRRIAASKGAAHLLMEGHPYETALAMYPMANEELRAEARTPASFQTAAEISACVHRNGPLLPSMDILVNRVAWAPLPDSRGALAQGVRITFDEDIRYRDLLGRSEACGQKALLEPGEAIMEVKVPGAYPLWLVDALNSCRAFPTSFSKYGEAYLACEGVRPPLAYRQQAEFDAQQAAAQLPAAGSPAQPIVQPTATEPSNKNGGENTADAEREPATRGAHARRTIDLPEVIASA